MERNQKGSPSRLPTVTNLIHCVFRNIEISLEEIDIEVVDNFFYWGSTLNYKTGTKENMKKPTDVVPNAFNMLRKI